MSAQPDFAGLREQMVEQQLRARGIVDERVLEAMGRVPREHFVPADLASVAYDDRALAIPEGQSISQPWIVALMLQALALRGDEKVLDVGTGSAYAAALLAELAREVFTIECRRGLADSAAHTLDRLGYRHVHRRHGDGALGWPEAAPFDGIAVAAGTATVPEPLRRQLAIGGRLVLPVGPPRDLELVCITRRGTDEWHRRRLCGVRFVPLVRP